MFKQRRGARGVPPDMSRRISVLVLCETYDKDGNPLSTNTRHKAAKTFSSEQAKKEKPWFGIEQEYFLLP